LGFSGFIDILTKCTNEIKTNFTKFELSLCSEYEECRLWGYDAVWPGINLLTCRRKILYLYHTLEASVNFTTLHEVTSQQILTSTIFRFFHTIFDKYMAAVKYTNIVNGKVSPSCRVATLVSWTGSGIHRTLGVF